MSESEYIRFLKQHGIQDFQSPEAWSRQERESIGPSLAAFLTRFLITGLLRESIRECLASPSATLPLAPPTKGRPDLRGSIFMEDYLDMHEGIWPRNLFSIAPTLFADLVLAGDERYRPYLIESLKICYDSEVQKTCIQMNRLSWSEESIRESLREILHFTRLHLETRRKLGQAFVGPAIEVLCFGKHGRSLLTDPSWIPNLFRELSEESEILDTLGPGYDCIRLPRKEPGRPWPEADTYLRHPSPFMRWLTINTLSTGNFPVAPHKAALVENLRIRRGQEACARAAAALLLMREIEVAGEELPPLPRGRIDEDNQALVNLKKLHAQAIVVRPVPRIAMRMEGDEYYFRVEARDASIAALNKQEFCIVYHRILKFAPAGYWQTDHDAFGLFIADPAAKTARHVPLPAFFPQQPTGANGAKRSLYNKPLITREGRALIRIEAPFSRDGWGDETFLFEYDPADGRWRIWEQIENVLRPRPLTWTTSGLRHADLALLQFDRDLEGKLTTKQVIFNPYFDGPDVAVEKGPDIEPPIYERLEEPDVRMHITHGD